MAEPCQPGDHEWRQEGPMTWCVICDTSYVISADGSHQESIGQPEPDKPNEE